ncbi:MAG TPA: ABC transporter permease [Candidatus Sulfomarinibacteraceae bacterium]|nr:ABC transporter permease [Candidatus Sulfomarinibacteraceae bacterium]
MARARSAALLLAAPGAALGLALTVAGVILALAGADPISTLRDALDYGLRPATLVAVANKAIPYYLAGIAAAVGFHLRLFNIGIDGQYRLAAFAAAVIGAAVALPAPLHLALIIGVALVVGWGWAAIAGLLFVRRGVNVVISTIMLNAVATGIIAYLLSPGRLGWLAPGSNNVTTATIPETGWIPAIPTPAGDLNGLLGLAVIVGVAYRFVLNRTTLGFEVRAMGFSERTAAVAGIRAPRLAILTMAASGAIAGLVGLPQLLGASHRFGLDFPAGLGFTGLSVAILGRNHPVGVAIGAFVWAFLERSAQVLDLAGVSREVVTILQAVIVLSIVVAYELVRRARARQERRFVAQAVEGVPA